MSNQLASHSSGVSPLTRLDRDRTGLPFFVWLGVADARRGGQSLRLTTSLTEDIEASRLAVVVIRPETMVKEGRMDLTNMRLLRRWIGLNEPVISKFWHSKIGPAEMRRLITSL